MIRARFYADDGRPVNWPVKHPFWTTGFADDYVIVVAYADSEKEIKKNWPEAFDIESEEVGEYFFSKRFPKPEWFQVSNDS
jgi:hypothetical protein